MCGHPPMHGAIGAFCGAWLWQPNSKITEQGVPHCPSSCKIPARPATYVRACPRNARLLAGWPSAADNAAVTRASAAWYSTAWRSVGSSSFSAAADSSGQAAATAAAALPSRMHAGSAASALPPAALRSASASSAACASVEAAASLAAAASWWGRGCAAVSTWLPAPPRAARAAASCTHAACTAAGRCTGRRGSAGTASKGLRSRQKPAGSSQDSWMSMPSTGTKVRCQA